MRRAAQPYTLFNEFFWALVIFTLMHLVTAVAEAQQTTAIGTTWVRTATVHDFNRSIEFAVNRDLQTKVVILEVRHMVDVLNPSPGVTMPVYEEKPCDLWIDTNNDSTFSEAEHFLPSGQKRRHTVPVGTLSSITEDGVAKFLKVVPTHGGSYHSKLRASPVTHAAHVYEPEKPPQIASSP